MHLFADSDLVIQYFACRIDRDKKYEKSVAMVSVTSK